MIVIIGNLKNTFACTMSNIINTQGHEAFDT